MELTIKTYICQVSIKEGKRKPPTLLVVELMASSPELAAKRARLTLWSRYRSLSLENITVTDTKEIVDK